MSNIQPLVSVIIPTYNGAKRIKKTLEAIINQDYNNLEIILVDDVSTDDTVKISQEVLEKSGRKFSIIRRTINGRQSASRNTGLKEANGKYVIFVDHDDLMDENFVSLLLNEAEEKNADLVFCGFRHYYEEEKRYKDDYVLKEINLTLSSAEDYIKAWAKGKIFIWGAWCFIFKKNFLEKNKLHFPEKCYIYEDFEFVIKAMALSSCISYIKETPYIYIHYPEQQSEREAMHRRNYKIFDQAVLSSWRVGRCILKNSKDIYVKKYTMYFIAEKIFSRFKLCIRAGDREHYDNIIKTLNHKKIREVMLSTVKFIFVDPELFFKIVMLLYFPNFYYWLRSKNEKH